MATYEISKTLARCIAEFIDPQQDSRCVKRAAMCMSSERLQLLVWLPGVWEVTFFQTDTDLIESDGEWVELDAEQLHGALKLALDCAPDKIEICVDIQLLTIVVDGTRVTDLPTKPCDVGGDDFPSERYRMCKTITDGVSLCRRFTKCVFPVCLRSGHRRQLSLEGFSLNVAYRYAIFSTTYVAVIMDEHRWLRKLCRIGLRCKRDIVTSFETYDITIPRSGMLTVSADVTCFTLQINDLTSKVAFRVINKAT